MLPVRKCWCRKAEYKATVKGKVVGAFLYHVTHVYLFCIWNWTPISFSITYRSTNIHPCRCEPRSHPSKKSPNNNNRTNKQTNTPSSSLNPLILFSLWQILQRRGRSDLLAQLSNLGDQLFVSSESGSRTKMGWCALCVPHNVAIVG